LPPTFNGDAQSLTPRPHFLFELAQKFMFFFSLFLSFFLQHTLWNCVFCGAYWWSCHQGVSEHEPCLEHIFLNISRALFKTLPVIALLVNLLRFLSFVYYMYIRPKGFLSAVSGTGGRAAHNLFFFHYIAILVVSFVSFGTKAQDTNIRHSIPMGKDNYNLFQYEKKRVKVRKR
jgi:hypothetical protein